MSWESIFTNIGNILKLITLIGPLLDFIESVFGKVFPGEKTGVQKKEMALSIGRVFVPPEVTDEEFAELIDGYVDLKNKAGEFLHTGPRVKDSISGF